MFFIKKNYDPHGHIYSIWDMTMKNKNYQYPNFAVNKMIIYKVSYIF